MVIKLYNLPKISLNKWYAGSMHWSVRKKLKDTYKLVVGSQCVVNFIKESKYKVTYTFNFKKNALDASNCVAMVKLIEDIIFEDDKYDIVTEITIKSRKSKEEFVEIEIEETRK
jgi:hypothetical protein